MEIFHWCGANPWTFKNWWEDNWLSDIYVPFRSLFYSKYVVVSNYKGIELTTEKSAEDRVQGE